MMDPVVKVIRPRSGQAAELARLVTGAELQSLAALVDLRSGKALTLGTPPSGSEAIDVSFLPVLARVLLDRGTEADAAQVRSVCSASGVVSAALLTPECDLLFCRVAGLSQVLCLAIQHGQASGGSFDSIVHARALNGRLQATRGKRVGAGRDGTVAAEQKSTWHHFMAFLRPSIREHDAKVRKYELRAAEQQADRGILRHICDADPHVVAADVFDLQSLAHVDSYRPPGPGVPQLREEFARLLKAFFTGELNFALIGAHYGLRLRQIGKVQVDVGGRSIYLLRVPYFPALRIPFDPEQVLMLVKPPRANPSLDWAAMDRCSLNLLRQRVGAILTSGIKTQMEPFPQTNKEFQAIIERIRELPEEDLDGRLDIGGFADHPVTLGDIEQRCAECIYYLPHKKWCDLPELPVPVEPQWWCRLWKL